MQMLESNNGQSTPRFYDDEHQRKIKNKSPQKFTKSLVPICKEEKPVFISYKPKTKKYFSAYEQINSKKENMQFISDVAQSYKFIENFKNKDLIDTAFKIDKDKHINSSQTNDLNMLSNTTNNYQKFYQTISNFKMNRHVPPLANFNLNAGKNEKKNIHNIHSINKNLNDNNNNNYNNNKNNSGQGFSQTQNFFLPKCARMYHKKRINLESKTTNASSRLNASQGANLFMTKTNFFSAAQHLHKSPKDVDAAKGETLNISSSDEENSLVVRISKKTKMKCKKKNLHDVELKFDCDNNIKNMDKTGVNFNSNSNNNSNANNNFSINKENHPLEISETETKFFKKYLNYIEYIKKKRLHSPENKLALDPSNNNNNNNFDNSYNLGLTSNNLSPKFFGAQAPNNSNYKEFQPKKNFSKIDISPFDIDIVEFRNAVAKSAEMVLDSLKAGSGNSGNLKTSNFKILEIEKAKKIFFKEIGQNAIFEKLLDKVFRKVIYVSDKNIQICEDYVVNLIHTEIGQLTERHTSNASDKDNNLNRKPTSGNAKTVNLPPIMKKGTASSNNSNLGLSAENIFGLKGNSSNQDGNKTRSRLLDLKGALSPIGEIELDTETKFKVLSDQNFSSKNALDNNGLEGDMGGLAAAEGQSHFYDNYKSNFQQQFDVETQANNKDNLNNKSDYRNSNFFKKYFNCEKKNGEQQGQLGFVESKSLEGSVDYWPKFDILALLCEQEDTGKDGDAKNINNESANDNNEHTNNDKDKDKDDNAIKSNKPFMPKSKAELNKKIFMEQLNSFVKRNRKDSPKSISLLNNNNNYIEKVTSPFGEIASQFHIDPEERNVLGFEIRKTKWALLFPNVNNNQTISTIKNTNSKKAKNIDNNTEDEAYATQNSDKESMRFISSNFVKQLAGEEYKKGTNVDINEALKASAGKSTSIGFFNNESSFGGSLNAKLNSKTILNLNNNENLIKDGDGAFNKALSSFNPNMTAATMNKKPDFSSNISLIPEEKEPAAPKMSKDDKGKKPVAAAAGKSSSSSKKTSGGAAAKKGKKELLKTNQKPNDKTDNMNKNKDLNIIKEEEFKNENLNNKNNSKSADKFASSASLVNPAKTPGSSSKRDISIKKNILGMKERHKSNFGVLDSDGNDVNDAHHSHKISSGLYNQENVDNDKYIKDDINKFETINLEEDFDNINLANLNLDDLPQDLASSINDVRSS